MSEFSDRSHDPEWEGPPPDPELAWFYENATESAIVPLDYENPDREDPADQPQPFVWQGDLPSKEDPIRVQDLKGLPIVVEGLVNRISQDHLTDYIEGGYRLPEVTVDVTHVAVGETGMDTPRDLTPVTTLYEAAADMRLMAFDRKLQIQSSALEHNYLEAHELNERAEAMHRKGETLQEAVMLCLEMYGVDPDSVEYMPRVNVARFPYKDSWLELSPHPGQGPENGLVELAAWHDGMTERERDAVEDKYRQLAKAGASLSGLHYYLETGQLPAHQRGVDPSIIERASQDREHIEAEYAAHTEKLKAFTTDYGYRHFQIHTPHMRHGIPLVLHIAEQPLGDVYQMIGEHSPTKGVIVSHGPGTFEGIRNPDAAWRVADNGLIVPDRTKRP